MSQQKKMRIEERDGSAAKTTTVSPSAAEVEEAEVGLPSTGTLNAIFALTAPRCNVLSLCDRRSSLDLLDDSVDDAIYMAVKDAWDAIAVPADQYWSHKSSLLPNATSGTATSPWSSYVQQAAKTTQARRLLIPDPRNLLPTFYPARLEAMASRGYATNRGALVVGLDKPHGNSSKLFNVLSRDRPDGDVTADGQDKGNTMQSVAPFVAGIKHASERNLYVLIDEDAPVDPFFDIDFSYVAQVATADRDEEPPLFPSLAEGAPVPQAEIEEALADVLRLLRDEVESGVQQKVERCLVLTSSVQVSRRATRSRAPRLVELKISFHVHFRLQNNAALCSIKDLHHLVSTVRAKMADESCTRGGHQLASEQQEQRTAALFQRLVDCGVYSRWRAFRLPYNVKTPVGPHYTLADAAADDLLSDQLAATGIPMPDTTVGAVAQSLIASVELAEDVELSRRQAALLKKLLFHFRFMTPVVPGLTTLTSKKLRDFLCEHPFCPRAELDVEARTVAVMDMAAIQRDDTVDSAVLKVSIADKLSASDPAKASDCASSPFSIPVPPRPTSVRVPVYDMNAKKLLAEIFACLSPCYAAEAAGPRVFTSFDSVPSAPGSSGGSNNSSSSSAPGIRAEHLYVQYEEGIRAYYVIQKQNKYCLRQNRCHKSTYAQLYLTYGSIKVRCFSNDCCDRCLTIPWEGSADTAIKLRVPGFPKHERLTAIRNILFPPLSPEELVRRYGAAALKENTTAAEVIHK